MSFSSIIDKIETILKRFNQGSKFFDYLIVRILISWASVGVILNLFAGTDDFTKPEFYKNNGLLLCVVIFICIFIYLHFKLLTKYIKPIFFGSFFVLFFQTLSIKADFGYYIGSVVIMAIIIGYCLKGYVIKKEINKVLAISIVGFCAIVVAGLVAVVSVLNYKSYWTSNFDFGLFSQMFHYMKETFQPLSTSERDGLLSHFAVHFSPIFYLLLPIYYVFPSPITLLVMQGIITVSGVIPVWLISRKYKHSTFATMLLSLCYLGLPPIFGGNMYYIHENVFLAPLLLWLFYFTEKKSYIWASVFALLVLFVKEDAAIYIIFFGLYLIVSKKNVKLGAGLTAFAVMYFIVVTGLMEVYGEGVMSDRFGNYSIDGEPVTVLSVFLVVFKNPSYFLSTCFNIEKIEFLLKLFLPVMFIPFITHKYSRFILLGPVVAMNLISDYVYFYDMGFQYVFGSAALVIYLTIINSADFNKDTAQKFLVTSATSAVLIFSTLYWGKTDVVKNYMENTEQRKCIEESLELIPDDASVISSTFFIPNLSQRDEIYELEKTEQSAEYYVLDLRDESTSYSVEDYQNEDFEEVCINQYIAIYKRVE